MSALLEQISGYSTLVKPEIAGLSLSPRRVILSQDADNEGFWTAECPELRGCISQGENVEAALANIKEAMELWLETALEMGDYIPATTGR